MQYTVVYCTDKLGIKLKLKIPRLMLKNLNKNMFSHSAHFYSACIMIDTCGVEMEGKRQTEKKPAFFTIVTSYFNATRSLTFACGGVCLRYIYAKGQ